MSEDYVAKLRALYSHRVALGAIGWAALFVTEGVTPPSDPPGSNVKPGTVPPRAVLFAVTSLPFIEWFYRESRKEEDAKKYYPSKLEKIGFGILITGVALQYYCRYLMGRHYTFSLSVKPGHTVCRDSIYNYIRHPGYLSAWLMWGGALMFCQNIMAVLCMAPPIGLSFGLAPQEEEFLSKHVDGYAQYMKEVKYRILPYIY